MFKRYHEIQARRAENPEMGFTLIELLIVIVVLGILAAVVIFALGGVTGSSAQAACNSDAKTVETAFAAWQAQNSSTTPPQATSGVSAAAAIANLGNTSPNPLIALLVPTYLHSWPSNAGHYTLVPSSATPTLATGTYTATANGDILVEPYSGGSFTAPTAANEAGMDFDNQSSASKTGCYAVS